MDFTHLPSSAGNLVRMLAQGRRLIEPNESGAKPTLILVTSLCAAFSAAALGCANTVAETDTDAHAAEDTERPPAIDPPLACPEKIPDALAERLCHESADPAGASEKVFIQCRTESACFGPESPSSKQELVVMSYNAERGIEVDEQIALLKNAKTMPAPDVLLVSELDRGCSRSGYRNIPREYAEALGMNCVFGVEFVELPRNSEDPAFDNDAICEHGNAVMSRFPLGNVEIFRHKANRNWYEDALEPRLGGRVAVAADVLVGSLLLHVVAIHFESGITPDISALREKQAIEIAEHGLDFEGPVIIGGDTNFNLYVFDLANGTHKDAGVKAFFDRGYLDAHAGLPFEQRPTHQLKTVIDLIMVREIGFSKPGVCLKEAWTGLSDHAPVWTIVGRN